MFRSLSVFIRLLQAKKNDKRLLKKFGEWKKNVQGLPKHAAVAKKVLIIRLDDIGDYLLFRNSLYTYKKSDKWQQCHFTLLGNIAWKPFFDKLDAAAADNAIWIDKARYFKEDNYRIAIWKQLSEAGFETVIAASRTRPLLLDDICMLVANAANNISAENTFRNSSVNVISNNLYNILYHEEKLTHDFFFNQAFANWCCNAAEKQQRPSIKSIVSINASTSDPYIICFIGASKNSRRWPARRWIELIKLIKAKHNYKIVLCGGKQDADMAALIQKETNAENITGIVSLPEMVGWVNSASAVVTNDTMASHLSVTCNKPTVIIANGDNFFRFSLYKNSGIENVETIYPKAFLNRWVKEQYKNFEHYEPVTADIATIQATQVLNALESLIGE